MQGSELLHGVVAWVVAWLLHGCCIVVAWKCSRFVEVYSFEVSYADVSGTRLYIGRFGGRAKEGKLFGRLYGGFHVGQFQPNGPTLFRICRPLRC